MYMNVHVYLYTCKSKKLTTCTNPRCDATRCTASTSERICFGRIFHRYNDASKKNNLDKSLTDVICIFFCLIL